MSIEAKEEKGVSIKENRENRDDRDNKDRSKFRDKNPSWKRQSSFKKKGNSNENGELIADYKDSRILQKFTSERGKVLPKRISAVSSKEQRKLAVAIKRARFLALLPYVAD